NQIGRSLEDQVARRQIAKTPQQISMKRQRRGHERIAVANTDLSPSCPRFRRRAASLPAVLILVMASCADNGLAPTDAATSTGDALRPDIATAADAAADAPTAA